MASVLIPTWQAQHVTLKIVWLRWDQSPLKGLTRKTAPSTDKLDHGSIPKFAHACAYLSRSLPLIYVLLNIAILWVDCLDYN
jgi:hypothetical protein